MLFLKVEDRKDRQYNVKKFVNVGFFLPLLICVPDREHQLALKALI